MPRGVPIQPDELQHMLDLFNDLRKRGLSIMECYKRIGLLLERDPKVVGVTINRLRDTTPLAKMYLRSKSYRLVKRLVAKAGPAEIIDILQRPSVGVLDPIKKVEGGGGGFFLTVNADSCGAVKVGVLQPPVQEQKQLESGDEPQFDPFADVIDVGQGASDEQNGDAPHRETAETSTETVIARVKRQLAQRRTGTGD